MLNNPNWSPPDVELADWQKLIRDGIAVLEESDWCMGLWSSYPESKKEAFCVVGAIQKAMWGCPKKTFPPRGDFDSTEQAIAYHTALDKLHAVVGKYIWNWNDSLPNHDEYVRERSKQRAIYVMQRAMNVRDV